MRVSYWDGFDLVADEWVCLEHSGYAKRKADAWWSERSKNAPPNKIETAIAIAKAGGLAEPTAIMVRNEPGSRWVAIDGYELPQPPLPCESAWVDFVDKDEEAPF
jgi:DNA repair protein RadD